MDEMNQVVPWDALVALIQPHARGAHPATGRAAAVCGGDHVAHRLPAAVVEPQRSGDEGGTARAAAVSTLRRVGRLASHPRRNHDLALSPPAGEAAARAAGATINAGLAQRGLVLKTGTVVDATIIAAPSSTKNKDGKRDPEMHQIKRETSGISA